MSRILLLEDDPGLLDGLTYSLKRNNYQVTVARTVKEAVSYLNTSHSSRQSFDLLLLDVTLPDGTGFQVCEKVRSMGNQVPIIFLTAADEEVNIIRGLDIGGDDYVTKPFKLGELCSRIGALLRRTKAVSQNTDTVITQGKLSIDLLGNRVYLKGIPVDLTNAEYRLLCLLVRNTGQIVTRERILDYLWDGAGNFVDDNTLSVYIRRLREKLEKDPSHPEYLITVRGFGYQWKEGAQ